MAAQVASITIFPMKSCDGLALQSASVAASGALHYDRQFALADATGRFINAKRTSLIHRLRLAVDPVSRTYEVGRRGEEVELHGRFDDASKQLSGWLSEFFSLEVSIVENDETGFPDDSGAVGPTIISTATLETIAGWFDGLTIDEVRKRFRANIEVAGVEPFWEDRLFRTDRQPQPFRVGDVLFGGINPCQRCVVPTRDSQTGEVTPAGFSQQFSRRREETLPAWAPREYFDHFYRLSTNTRLLNRGGGMIRVGDLVELDAI
jgi:uncharacterized protein